MTPPTLDAQDSAALVGGLLALALAANGLVRTLRADKHRREQKKAASEDRDKT